MKTKLFGKKDNTEQNLKDIRQEYLEILKGKQIKDKDQTPMTIQLNGHTTQLMIELLKELDDIKLFDGLTTPTEELGYMGVVEFEEKRVK